MSLVRAPSYDEETEVLGFFEAMVQGLADAVLGDRVLAIQERDEGAEVVLCSAEVLALPDELRLGDAGLVIGHLEDGFRLALQGAVEVARHTEEQAVRVREKAARLFVYGRDVLGDSVLRYDRRLGPGDHCIVLDPRGEALGIGVVVGRFKGNRPALRAVHDLGSYLRDQ